jgi:hypothetical protein
MSATTIARRLRTPAFIEVAEFATEHGYAVGSPDESGRPRILASVHLVAECARCGLHLPEDHTCTTREEASHG